MKKVLAVLIIIILAGNVRAQVLATANSPEYNNILKMSASLFVRSTFQMGFEHFFNQNTSLNISAGMNFQDSDYDKNFGVRTEAQMRFHVFTVIKPTESNRLYFAPYLMNHYLVIERNNYYSSSSDNWYKDTFNAFSGGMLFGWSYTFANRVNLDIYSGGGLRKTFGYDEANGYSDGIFEYGYSGIMPRFGIDLGFWF